MEQANTDLLAKQHDIIRQSRQQIEALSARLDQPIAIIGMDCRVPGADSPQALWQLLAEGRETVSEVPRERWDIEDYYAQEPGTPGKTYARRAGYLRDLDLFDTKFFGISPREAQQMDPQQRLLLEVSYQALEHARLPPSTLRDQAVGVFVGISSSEYAVLTFGKERQSSQDAYSVTGTSTNSAAGRLAYFYGFNGPALAIDTACSSSLVAIYQACRSLVNDECHTALAGGVNCLLLPEPNIALAQNKVLSASGHCSPFSAKADGMVRSEGCGVLVLKRLSDALAENCPVLAVIRGGHVNQDGASSGLTVPNGYAQQSLIMQALKKAKLEPAAIRYVEAHGTGTALGDPIEARALQQALCAGQERSEPLLIGSLKAHIGHLEAASGIASVIKVVLALQHRLLPAQINLDERTPHVDWNAGLDVVREAVPLVFGPDTPFYAGVSSFGFSGTNAHLILQDACSAVPGDGSTHPAATAPLTHFLGISAKDPVALKTLLASNRDFFAGERAWGEACEALNAGRTHYPWRAGFVAKDREALIEQLEAACRGEPATPVSHAPALAWLFTGQGSQYVQMGRALFDTEPAFRALLESCDRELSAHLGRSILPVIWGEVAGVNATEYTQPAIFCLQYALSHFLLSLGVQPRFVLGHSIGEYAAAVVAGVFGLRDAARMIVYRGRLMAQRCTAGGMLALLADRERADALVREGGAGVVIAVINGPNNHVLSGEPAVIERLARLAQEQGLRCVPLPVSHAFHSPLMDPMLDEFEQVVRQTEFSRPRIGFISSALGRVADSELTDPAYWVKHVRDPVLFEQAMAALAVEDDWTAALTRLCLEIGPHEQIIGMARMLPIATMAQWRNLLQRNDDLTSFAEALRSMYMSGMPLHWPRKPPQGDPLLPLPSYPFARQRYWLPDVSGAAIIPSAQDYAVEWIAAPLSGSVVPVRGHWLLLVEDEAFARSLSRQLTQAGASVVTLSFAAAKLPVDLDLAGFDAVIHSVNERAQAPAAAAVHALIRLAGLVSPTPGAPGPRLICVVDNGAAGYLPMGSSLASACRCLREEETGLTLTLAGLDADLGSGARAQVLLSELGIDRGADWERRVVDGHALVPRLAEVRPAKQQAAVPLRADRSYLITGGTGALGLVFADALIGLGARDVVLASRSCSDAGLAPLRASAEAAGARLTVYKVDLCAPDTVHALFERLSQAHAPLAGIIHAAGQLADAGFRQMDAQAFDRAFGAKAGGAWLLDHLSRDLALDFFLMTSSIAAVLGAPGQTNYAAANGYLDALAQQRRAAGRPAVSLRLGAMAGAGMAGGEIAARQLLRAGVVPVDPVQLRIRSAQWFAQLEPLAMVASFDWSTIHARQGRLVRPLLEAFVPGAAAASPLLPPVAVTPAADVRRDLDAVGTLLRETIASTLAMPDPQAIGDDETLNALGMDSVTLVELRGKLARQLGCELPTHLLFDFPQVGKLARHLHALLNEDSTSASMPLRSVAAASEQDIAIVGIGCRFPGGVNSPEAFWSALLEGRDLVGQVDALRWDASQLVREGALVTARAGIIDDVDAFDCEFFGITPREAQCMDPQQRLLLELGWEALERSGYDFAAQDVVGGIFVGPGPNDYARRFDTEAQALSHHHSTGNALSVTAGRLAFMLDWQGPALAVDTACSSSLMAVHLAVQSLRTGECDIALAGGVNLLLSPETSVLLSKGNMLASDGRCKTFDARADGYVRSEGCGMVVLKRLGDALADGDQVLAVVRGTAANHDGHSQGLTAPNGQAQQRVLRQALADASVDPAQVELLEAHGTGTPLGDPIEMAAAQAVYVDGVARQAPLWISSVKTNIGHAEAAAGIAGLIKAVLCLQHGTIVPHLHFTQINPEVKLDPALVHIPTNVQAWPGNGIKYASVSSFGFSGTNVHVVLQSAPVPTQPASRGLPPAGLRISAASHMALVELMRVFRDVLADLPPEHYAEFRAQAWRRVELRHTQVIEAATPAVAVESLNRLLLELGAASGGARDAYPSSVGRVPTYPFERQRFWLNPPANKRRAAPLGLRLGARDAHQVVYALDYAQQPPFRLEDHLVHGKPVVPAAAHLALIVGMLDDLRGKQAWQLVDVLCEEPLVVDDDNGVVRYQFSRLPEGDAGYSVEVLSDASGRTRRHLRAHAHAATVAPKTVQGPASGSAVARIDGEAFYDRLYSPEIRLAHTFRSITSIEQYVGHSVAEVAWTTPLNGLLVPGELDSLLQTIALATLADQPERSHMGGATIPLAIDRLTVRPRVRPEVSAREPVVCVTRLVNEDDDGGSFVHDLAVAEPGHLPFLSIEGLVTRRISEQQIGQTKAGSSYLVEEWVARPLQDDRSISSEPILVFLNSAQDAIGQRWHSFGAADGGLDASTCDDAAVLQAVGERAACLLFRLPPVADLGGATPCWADHAFSLVMAARRVSRLSKALSSAGKAIGFCVISEHHPLVAGEGAGSPLYGFAQGLCKSLSLEWPERVVSMLDADGATLEHHAPALLAELSAAGGDWVAYRGGHRHVLRIAELPLPSPIPLPSFRCHDDGIYLVTGGLGDLAVETCRWLSGKGARHLLLVGRRTADARIAQQLAELHVITGARIDYRPCDVADGEALAGLFAEVGRSGAVRGIFHCAGVLADGTFEFLDNDDFGQVMQAKLLGSWHLHRLSLELELDCFVMYSSLASLFGAAGQSNYAAANGFMDQLAQFRRRQGLPALSINWSGWDGIGMASKQETRGSKNGLRRLAPAQAIVDLERAMATERAQLGVVDVDWPVFANQWHGKPPALVEDWLALRLPAKGEQSVTVASVVVRALQELPLLARPEAVRQRVRAIARHIMALDDSRPFADDKPFQELGFDSLMSIELKSKLQENFGIRVPATVVFDYPNVESLVAYIMRVIDLDETRPAPQPAAMEQQADALDDLDEDQLSEILEKLL
ncbi:type I polyketide synthase [Janthinobacterium lividum]|uniref:type I polyketide synthase n=1 Tax=Janthinobacterium lividum TaxID=29581 RepID=UPI0008735ED3|nr:type I polyketide synthase [Janthinobacterium lividum]MCC7716673.1 type I polyketide synthase [Janthinobacterium lividum]OEZ51800.1 erythronolide synthase, modules 5 and 6 [Janthinobacterium lividum]WQE31744.1 type I polyketide synthase [Janthinobacterium lividum]STS86014.1 Erythronolide synthase, modules 5 and 6 [Janthinobacterium lividum]